MNLEDLVPPLELCKQIPEGCFEDSALVWRWNGNNGAVFERDGFPQEKYPAPTLQEILLDLNNQFGVHCPDCYRMIRNTWRVSCNIFTNIDDEYRLSDAVKVAKYVDGNNSAEAALRLWLEVNKTYESNKIYEIYKTYRTYRKGVEK